MSESWPIGAGGPQGAQGAAGASGAQGITGSQGPQGAQGAAGASGAQGITGSQGPQGAQGAAGASGAGFTELRYMPDLTTWTDTGVAPPTTQSQILRIGAKLYIFGGNTYMQNSGAGSCTAKIYSANWADSPPVWVDTGAVMPWPSFGWRVCIIGNYVYAYYHGGYNGTSYGGVSTNTNLGIYRAPVSSPTAFVATGTNAPSLASDAHAPRLAIAGGNVVGMGIQNETDLVYAVTSSPSAMGRSSNIPGLGYNIAECGVAVVGDKVVTFGGSNYAKTINRLRAFASAAATNPTFEYGLVDLFGQSQNQSPEVWAIGNKLFLFGGSANANLFEVDPNNLFGFGPITYSNVMPHSYFCLGGSSFIGADGYMYVLGEGNIARSGRIPVMTTPQVAGSSQPLLACTPDGQVVTFTSSQLLGYPSWLTNRTDLA